MTPKLAIIRQLVSLKFLPSATNMRQGNVFTPVCHFVYRGTRGRSGCNMRWNSGIWWWGPGGRHSPWADTPHPLADTPFWADTPGRPLAQCMLGYGQQADGTHPTGMHSCFVYS